MVVNEKELLYYGPFIYFVKTYDFVMWRFRTATKKIYKSKSVGYVAFSVTKDYSMMNCTEGIQIYQGNIKRC